MGVVVVATLLLLPIVAHSAEESLRNSFVLTKRLCHKNVKYVDKCIIPYKPVNRTTSITSTDVYLRPEVILKSPIFISFTLNKKFTIEYKPYMMNLKYELCDILKFRNNPLFKVALEMANRSENNFMEPCPLKGHRFIKPYYTSYESMPMIPAGLWRLDIAITIELDKKNEEVLRFQNFYERRSIVLTKTSCYKNAKYVDRCTVPLKPINRTTSLTSTDVYLRPDVLLKPPILISLVANKKFSVEYKPYLVNLKYELCEVLKYRNNPLFKIAFELSNRSESNILDPCPLKGHKFVKPYYTSYDSIPMVPPGLWRFDINIAIEVDKKDEEIIRIQNFYEVTEH